VMPLAVAVMSPDGALRAAHGGPPARVLMPTETVLRAACRAANGTHCRTASRAVRRFRDAHSVIDSACLARRGRNVLHLCAAGRAATVVVLTNHALRRPHRGCQPFIPWVPHDHASHHRHQSAEAYCGTSAGDDYRRVRRAYGGRAGRRRDA